MSDHHTATPSTLVLGLGNEYRSDDAIGLLAARRLRECIVADVTILESSGDQAANLFEAWKGFERVFLIDAMASGAPTGTIHRFEAHHKAIPSKFFHFSSHAFGVGDAIEMARTLRMLPRKLIVYGIEGERYDAGIAVSPRVADAMESVIGRIADELVANGRTERNQ